MTPPQPPQITPEQRAAALAKAGEARRIRAEIKELLKTGSLTMSEVFDRARSEDYVAGLKVESLLESLPGMGKIGAKRLLESLEIAPNRRLRGLGERQRKALLSALG
ncbi:MAG TPA: integration host factor, actinobacterial type [Acidimicrobiia bacterium]|nr:integration host factor, actinobacterial type [Acidimicrobiia bacterium]